MKRPDLLKAAINCPHQITEKSVILHFDEKAHGHNALQQLGNRLERELHTAYKSNDDLVVIRTAITDDKNDIEGLRSAIRVLTPNFQTWIGKVLDELVTLRAQADARPVAWQVHPFDYGIGSEGVYARTDRQEQVEGWKCKGWAVQALYTHPEASAPGLSDDEIKSEALEHLQLAETEVLNAKAWSAGEQAKTHCKFALTAIAELRAILTRASAATVAEPSDKLDAPAQVGNTVFGKGVEKRLVIEAAQRNHQRTHHPTEEDKRIAAATESIARLRQEIGAQPAESDTDNVWPIVNITVSESGEVTAAKLYAPGLPAGNHDVYPVRVPYMDEHTEAWMAVANALQEVAPGYLDDSGNGIECAVKAIHRLAAQQQAEPGADERVAFEAWAISQNWPVGKFPSGKYHNPGVDAAEMAWLARAAQSGQRAGVADVAVGEAWYARLPHASALIHCWVRDVTAETVLLRENDYTNGVRYLRSDVTFIERIAAAPTQQQEGGK
ncbi:Uncharacterised protein [Ralstonia mannitolilytica]|uniref:hypothetical protein n=1 Tax=Ralstonia mannitolilytica TaxID=105219 RepID=UPI000DFAD708|nr:hypothetical protein [Ralstonia mannitolilytica]SUD94262.1 Uncharacterised protein [Ralstonia mannitolilytica]